MNNHHFETRITTPSVLAERPAHAGELEFDFRELWDFLWSGRWLILAIAGGVTVLGAAYALLATPVYRTDGLIQVEEDRQGLASLSELSSVLGATPVQTPAEISILRSRMVIRAVVDKLGLRTAAEPEYFPLLGRTIARWTGGADSDQPAPPLLGLGSYAWGGERIVVRDFNVPRGLEDQQFEIVAAAAGGYELWSPDGDRLGAGKAGERLNAQAYGQPLSVFVQELVARPGTRFALTRYGWSTILRDIDDRLTVQEQTKDSGIIQVQFQDRDPQRAADFVDALQTEYVRQNVARHSEEAQQSLAFLHEQLPMIRQKLDEAQQRLNAYQTRQGSADVKKETELVLDQAVALETQRQQLAQQRDVQSQRYTAQHPVMEALNEQVRSVDADIARLRARVEALPQTQQEIFGLMRDLRVNEELYTAMLNSMQELQVAKAGTVGNVRIIDEALVPSRPSQPQRILILLASMIMGGIIGVVTLVMRRVFTKGVERPEDVEQALGLPTYALIPYTPRQRSLLREHERGKRDHSLLAASDPTNLAVEALRSLRTALHFALMESASNIVMFTGPQAELGKSFVSMNLGVVLAQTGSRVVVVDADLRRGRLDRYVSMPVVPGIADWVTGRAQYEALPRSTPVENLFIVTNGTTPPNPSEVLLHRRFEELIRQLARDYDYVLIDTPPILPVTDASIVGRLATATFLVLKAGDHPMRAISESCHRLQQAGITVRGVIFNQVGRKVGERGYGMLGKAYGYTSYAYEPRRA